MPRIPSTLDASPLCAPQEVETQCARERQAAANAFERERTALRAECESDANTLRTDLDNCEMKVGSLGDEDGMMMGRDDWAQ